MHPGTSVGAAPRAASTGDATTGSASLATIASSGAGAASRLARPASARGEVGIALTSAVAAARIKATDLKENIFLSLVLWVRVGVWAVSSLRGAN